MSIEQSGPYGGFFRGKRVLVTGHTGFKGAWLCLWLKKLGAIVTGYALPPPTSPSLFEVAEVFNGLSHNVGDIRDRARLSEVMASANPDIVFHLAAQALVRASYANPIDTYDVNIMGTVSVLEAVRSCKNIRACVVVTSDKCYENREWHYAYRENDSMGGYDPYSSSKGCAELVTAAYRNSFFSSGDLGIASVRAGNVIGGADWADDRIVPDCIRALSAGKPVYVRNPNAIRPWQHVLEPLSGYLWLASRLWQDPRKFSESWNFGPDVRSHVTVKDIVDHAISVWGEGEWMCDKNDGVSLHEANFLKLDCSKARDILGWHPVYSFEESVKETIEWYKIFYQGGGDMAEFTVSQIKRYEISARDQGIASWVD